MCSFGSCQTRFEFLSQFRKVRNAFECFVTQVQTHLPKTKRVWPMKINVICQLHIMGVLISQDDIISHIINDFPVRVNMVKTHFICLSVDIMYFLFKTYCMPLWDGPTSPRVH